MDDAREEEVLDDVSWDEVNVLRPGMDFKDGMTFVTIPGWLTVAKKTKAGEVMVRELGLAVVTSDGGRFRYLPEDVERLGYNYPDNVVVPKVRRWSGQSIESFRAGETQPPDVPQLYRDIRTIYETYIEFSREEYYDIMTLFVMGSYIFRLFKSLGYIHFNGTAASGKSQNLNILKAIAFNTAWASSMSSAALYRSLAGNPGTVCIDEAEGWEGERGEELRRILNSGYLDGSTVHRVERGPGDKFFVNQFEAYSPKAIASINPLDQVIGSRCLVVGMRPALRRIPEFDNNDPQWEEVRDRLYLWMMYYAPAIAEHSHLWNTNLRNTEAENLIGRQWQISQTYIIIGDFIDRLDGGNRRETLARFFEEYFIEVQKQLDASDRVRLVLRTLPRVLATRTPMDEGWYYLKTIHEVVSEYIEEDAKEYYKTRAVGRNLDTLGFKKRRAHKQGQQVWLDPQQIRQELLQRRVQVDDEDVPWLKGEVEYTGPEITHDEYRRDDRSIWDDPEEPE